MFRSKQSVMILAFAAVYLIWGSTYLVIKIGIETIPPFLMAGTRFVVSGALLLAFAIPKSGKLPTASQWGHAFVVGTLMLAGGNGGVTWSEQRVASSVAALIITTVPLWMVVLDSTVFRGPRPTRRIVTGLLLGVVGVLVLIRPSGSDLQRVDPVGALALVLAALSWALGSLRSRHVDQPESPSVSAGLQMLTGGFSLLMLGTGTGEWSRLDVGAVSARSAGSLLYLILLGIGAMIAYVWLLRNTTAAKVGTYALVNPIVAVILGWLVANEPVTGRTWIAAGLIIGAVALIQFQRRPARRREKASLSKVEATASG